MLKARNQALDALRGIAVLIVVASHYTAVLPYSVTYHLLWLGSVGVDLFFVLSGFLISGLLFSEIKSTGSIDLKRFWIRRGFKIYPPFYALLFLTMAFLLAVSGRVPGQFLYEAIFLQNYFPHFWPHTWSLAVEEHFYFALPLVLILLSKIAPPHRSFRLIPILSVLICCFCLYLRIAAFRHYHDWDHVAFPTHLRIDALFAGVTLGYFAHYDELSFREATRLWVLMVGLIFTTTFFVLPDIPRLTFAYVAFCFIVSWAVNQKPSNNTIVRALARIGFYSYSIYLWHAAAVVLLQKMPQRWYRFPVYIGSAILLGIVMSKLIEIPALRFREAYESAVMPVPANKTQFASAK